MADGVSWPSYGRDYTQSALLDARAGRHDERRRGSRSRGTFSNGIVVGYETSPIVIDGTMYITTPLNHVVALDAATGAKKWEYVHHYRRPPTAAARSTAASPCMADACSWAPSTRASSRSTRRPATSSWDVQVGDNEHGYHITGAPIAIDGKVITGISLRRAGRPLLRERVRCRRRARCVALVHDPVAARRRMVGIVEDDRSLRHAARAATSPQRSATARSTPTRGSTAARRCGMTPRVDPALGLALS